MGGPLARRLIMGTVPGVNQARMRRSREAEPAGLVAVDAAAPQAQDYWWKVLIPTMRASWLGGQHVASSCVVDSCGANVLFCRRADTAPPGMARQGLSSWRRT